MNELIRHIEFLLVTNDCVVIPGLGAILAHALPARYSDGSSCVLPPSRVFSFNASLAHNDGLLVGSISRSKSVSFEAARDYVAGEVETMRRKLASDGSLSLGLVGSLTLTPEGNLSFCTYQSSLLSPSCFWLPAVSLTPVAELARRQEQLRLAEAKIRSNHSLSSYVLRVSRVAASIALLVALAFVLATPVKVEQAQYASLGIENFTPHTPDHTEVSALRVPDNSSSVVSLRLRAYDDASEQVDTAARAAYVRDRHTVVTPRSYGAPHFDSRDPYCLIVASLVSDDDANLFIRNSKYPHQLGILAKDGRYRVYAATGLTEDQAREAATEIAGHFSGYWVCQR